MFDDLDEYGDYIQSIQDKIQEIIDKLFDLLHNTDFRNYLDRMAPK